MKFQKGSCHTPETRAKISAAKRGKPQSPEHREKLRAAKLNKPSWNKGKKMDPASVAKMAASKRGKPQSSQARLNISAGMKRMHSEGRGHVISPEHRYKGYEGPKRCPRCNETDLTKFHKSRTAPHFVQTYCIACYKADPKLSKNKPKPYFVRAGSPPVELRIEWEQILEENDLTMAEGLLPHHVFYGWEEEYRKREDI